MYRHGDGRNGLRSHRARRSAGDAYLILGSDGQEESQLAGGNKPSCLVPDGHSPMADTFTAIVKMSLAQAASIYVPKFTFSTILRKKIPRRSTGTAK